MTALKKSSLDSLARRLSTINDHEVAKFSKMSSAWWDPNGPMRPLHRMTFLRMGYIAEQVKSHFKATPFSHLRVLDVGCGGGIVAQPLARLGCQVVGIDASASNISVAKEHAKGLPFGIRFEAQTSSDLLGTDLSSFDLILALEVVEHVNDPALFVSELAKLLKENGLLIVSTINRSRLSRFLAVGVAEDVMAIVPKGTHDASKFITPQELEKHFLDSHLKPIDGSLVPCLYLPWPLDGWIVTPNKGPIVNYFYSAYKQFT